MKGLKKVAGETKFLRGFYDSIYLQLCYDKRLDEVFTIQHCDLGHSWQTFFDDEDIINVCNLYNPHTMQDIHNLVLEKVG